MWFRKLFLCNLLCVHCKLKLQGSFNSLMTQGQLIKSCKIFSNIAITFYFSENGNFAIHTDLGNCANCLLCWLDLKRLLRINRQNLIAGPQSLLLCSKSNFLIWSMRWLNNLKIHYQVCWTWKVWTLYIFTS